MLNFSCPLCRDNSQLWAFVHNQELLALKTS